MKYYDFKLNNKETFDVYDILESIDKKLIENNIKVDINEFNNYSEVLKYIYRCFFKENTILDLKKCLNVIDDLSITSSLGKKVEDKYMLVIKNTPLRVKNITKKIAEKLQENNIQLDRMSFIYYSQALKYIMRMYLKDEKVSDIKKAKYLISLLILRLENEK